MIRISNIKYQISKLHIKIKNVFKNFAFCIAILIFAFCILNFSCYAQAVSSTELINNAKEYDGKIVTYEGEVIGDIMERGDFCWINLYDGKSAIGVWLKKDMAKVIKYRGGYRFKGDWIRVKGVFNRSCLQHGGDLDIHVNSLEKIESGREIKERINLSKLNLSIKLGGVFLCLTILNLFLKRQRKR